MCFQQGFLQMRHIFQITYDIDELNWSICTSQLPLIFPFGNGESGVDN